MKKNQIILFDGICNLCNSSIQFILKYEKNVSLKFASLQSEHAKNILQKNDLDISDFNTIIFVQNNTLFFKSKAIFQIAKYLKFPFNLIRIFRFLPLFFTDGCYNYISKNRYSFFGKKDSCYLPTKELLNRFYQ